MESSCSMDPVYLETLMKASLDEKRELLNSPDRKILAASPDMEEIKEEEAKDELKLTQIPSAEKSASSKGDQDQDSKEKKVN